MPHKQKGGVLQQQVSVEVIAKVLAILVILFTSGSWLYDYLGTPHFEPQDKKYVAAYFQYDTIENNLFIEVVPDGHGRAVDAACQALKEVASHRWINHNIADKPLRVTLGWRHDTEFVPYVYWVEYPDDMEKLAERDCLSNSTRAVKHFMDKVYVDPSVSVTTLYDRYKLTVNNSTVTVIPMEEVQEVISDGDYPVTL